MGTPTPHCEQRWGSEPSKFRTTDQSGAPKRAQALNYRGLVRPTGNGQFVLVQNATPAQSVTVVDRKAEKFTAEIQTPGCWGTLPAASHPTRFAMLCGDGTVATITLDDNGQPTDRQVSGKLFDADAEYSADTLEGIYDQLEKAGKQVLSGDVTDALAGEVLGAIARQEDLNGRIRRNVMDTRRAVSFMMRSKMLNAEQFEEARQILRDIDSLDSHTAFLFDKINFLMDATVGFININQNKIIKIFSVASVALLPPTLIASIYGMNFQYMPELNQSWGYPFALALMVASALVPMWYFRRRGWLK